MHETGPIFEPARVAQAASAQVEGVVQAPLTCDQQQLLLGIARQSIEHGLDHGTPLPVDSRTFEAPLRRIQAVFVTLELHGELRGCIGSVEPDGPLVESVARHAYSTAFGDPRFPAMRRDELQAVSIELSLLSGLVELTARDEAELIERLRPGEDGLVLALGDRRTTYLPSVWRLLPEPQRFVMQLKLKAGLSPTAWPEGLGVWRYRAERVAEQASPSAPHR